jgi:hypothetical protein
MILPMACPEILACVQLASMVVAARRAALHLQNFCVCAMRTSCWRPCEGRRLENLPSCLFSCFSLDVVSLGFIIISLIIPLKKRKTHIIDASISTSLVYDLVSGENNLLTLLA